MPEQRQHDYQWARDISDEEWCQFLAGTPKCGRTPPPLPSDDFQLAWTGAAGVATFREAMAFCRMLKSVMAANRYNLNPESRLLDIGVGWGRLYRVLLRETPNIIGIDPVPDCIELCRTMLTGAQVELSPAAPPYRFVDGAFDVVYLYSVFSHLNEPQFRAVLHEAARVVRTGGFIAFTTLSPSSLPPEFPKTWAADAAAARFIHTPTGGGHESMPASEWGWTMLSEPYLRRILPAFPASLVTYTETSPQTFVALQKQRS